MWAMATELGTGPLLALSRLPIGGGFTGVRRHGRRGQLGRQRLAAGSARPSRAHARQRPPLHDFPTRPTPRRGIRPDRGGGHGALTFHNPGTWESANRTIGAPNLMPSYPISLA